jgi:hypothetical protein
VTNQANLPPGFNTQPIQPSSNTTPGIPAPGEVNVSNGAKGATTPGIPPQSEMGKPLPKGATPTPGIPANPLKRENNPPLANGANNPPAMSDSNSNGKVKTIRKP